MNRNLRSKDVKCVLSRLSTYIKGVYQFEIHSKTSSQYAAAARDSKEQIHLSLYFTEFVLNCCNPLFGYKNLTTRTLLLRAST